MPQRRARRPLSWVQAPAPTRRRPGPTKARARARSTAAERRRAQRGARPPARPRTARPEPQAPRSSARPRHLLPAHSTRGLRSAVVQRPEAVRPSPWERAPQASMPPARAHSRLERAGSTTAPKGWQRVGMNRPVLPTPVRGLPEAPVRPPVGRPRTERAPRAGQLWQQAPGPPAADPTTVREQRDRPTTEQPRAVRGRTAGTTAAGARPSPARVLTGRVEIPRSDRVRVRPQRAPRANPRSAREQRAVSLALPTCPGQASPAKQPVDPSSAKTMAERPRSARLGSRYALRRPAEPTSTRLQRSDCSAMLGELEAPTSCACAGGESLCRGCRRPAPSTQGLCRRIQRTSGGEPPFRRFRP